MTCATLAALAGAVVSQFGGDQVVIGPSPGAWAEVCYSNSGSVATIGDDRVIEYEGLEVRVFITARSKNRPGGGVSPAGAESFQVWAPVGFLVEPPGMHTVLDGDEKTVLIQWAAF